MRAGVILVFLPVFAQAQSYGSGSYGSDASPSALPIPSPTSPHPVGCPTASPTAIPTATPFPAPTAGSASSYGSGSYGGGRRQLADDPCVELAQNLSVAVSVSVSGIACASFGSDEEAIFKDGVAATLNGVEPGHIGDVACDDTGRRLSAKMSLSWLRRRLTDSADLSFELSIPPSELSGLVANATTSAELASSVVSGLVAAVSSGALATNIQAAASSAGNAAMAGVTATRCAQRALAHARRRPERGLGTMAFHALAHSTTARTL